jgi:hypothetical protein
MSKQRAIINRGRLLILAALALLACGIVGVFEKCTRPTREIPAEAVAREEALTLCHLKSVCAKFGAVREACATAGDYKLCVNIKMGSDAEDMIACGNDGTVLAGFGKMPNPLRCLFLRIP